VNVKTDRIVSLFFKAFCRHVCEFYRYIVAKYKRHIPDKGEYKISITNM